MQDYQRDFIQFAAARAALKFGQFTLKSGRESPYFFNAGALIETGAALSRLGHFYAQAIVSANLQADLLFGPAYKGIPLAAAAAAALAERHGQDLGYAFNRKEAKDHGEGGNLVGHAVAGRKVLIIDDVITAGTAIRESIATLSDQGAVPAGVIVALDRQERGPNGRSAIQEIEAEFNIPVGHIIQLDDLVDYLRGADGDPTALTAIEAHRANFGV